MSDFIQVVDRQGRILALMDRYHYPSIGRSPTYMVILRPPLRAYYADMGDPSEAELYATQVAFQVRSERVVSDTGRLRERIEWLIPLCNLPKEFYKLPGVIDARTMFKS